MTYIKDFDQVGRGDVGVAGGKGANLGELAQAGFPVPPGFVLTTAAYADFVEANGLAPRILELATLPRRCTGNRLRRRRATHPRAVHRRRDAGGHRPRGGRGLQRARPAGSSPGTAAYGYAGGGAGPRPRPKTLPRPASPGSRRPT